MFIFSPWCMYTGSIISIVRLAYLNQDNLNCILTWLLLFRKDVNIAMSRLCYYFVLFILFSRVWWVGVCVCCVCVSDHFRYWCSVSVYSVKPM